MYVFTDGELLTAGKLNSYCVNPDSASNSVRARADRNTNGPTWAASTFVQVAGFTSKPYDTAGIIDATSGVITIPSAGLWRIEFTAHMPNYASAFRRRFLIFKGTAAPTGASVPVGEFDYTTTGKLTSSVAAEEVCVAGDKFTVWVWSDTANATGLNPTDTNVPLTSLKVRKVMD